MSEFPNTPIGRANSRRQATHIEYALLCMVNAERARLAKAMGWLIPQARIPKSIGRPGRPSKPGLGGAAARHLRDSLALRWWGRVTPGKNCIPQKEKPELCDSHINPQNNSTPHGRAAETTFPGGCKGWSVAENTYVGWGQQHVTPRAAFEAWRKSFPHYKNMIQGGEYMVVSVALGSADPDAGSTVPAVTYVQMFGSCW
ncbi:hypothetical protein [Nonomuraea recticatena]